MSRVTKAMLLVENDGLRNRMRWLVSELDRLEEYIKNLKDCGDGRIIRTLCCAHDKAIDALSHALVENTKVIEKLSR